MLLTKLFTVLKGFPVIYRLHRLLQPLQNTLKKEKESSKRVITSFSSPEGDTVAGAGAPDMFRPIPSTSEWLLTATGYISAPRLILCSCKQGDRASPMKKSGSGRDAYSHGGKSMMVTVMDRRDEQPADMTEAQLH